LVEYEANIVVRSLRFVHFLYKCWRVSTDPANYFRSLGTRIGNNCRIWGANIETFGSEPYLIQIGNNVVIEHDCDFITHDGGIRQFRKIAPDIDVMGTIVIGNDVVIGAHCILLSGTVIGDRSVVNPASVVKGQFEPGSIISGHPARSVGTVERYWEQVKDKTVPTFLLSPSEKRKFLEKHFGTRLQPADPVVSDQKTLEHA